METLGGGRKGDVPIPRSRQCGSRYHIELRVKEGGVEAEPEIADDEQTPSAVNQVAKAWQESAMRAAEIEIDELGQTGSEAKGTRDFWENRLYLHKDPSDKGPRWVIADNYEKSSNIIYYPDSDEWYSMPSYGSESLMQGGFSNALEGAKIFWTG